MLINARTINYYMDRKPAKICVTISFFMNYSCMTVSDVESENLTESEKEGKWLSLK